jgi:hypothetical protein
VQKAWWTLAVVLLVIAAASCSDEEDGPPPSPSSALPPTGATVEGGSGGTGASGPTASGPTGTSGLPSGSTGAGAGTLTGGGVTLHTSGDIEVDRTLPMLVSGVYTAPPGGFALVWTAGGTDATIVGIGGASFVGTRPTSPELTLTLTVQTANDIASFMSTDGECDVTIDVALERRIAGSFRCDDLPSDAGDLVAVSATFEAEG